jgi:5-methylcytosine-specific restriction endonuclease McrA
MNRRTALARKTGLHAYTPRARVAGLRPKRRRHVASNTPVQRTTTAQWGDLRDELWDRTGGGFCEKCGLKLSPLRWDAHHRLMRSHGGRDELPNLVALHPSCHTVAPGSVHQDTGAAYVRGLLLTGFGRDPRTAPLTLSEGRPVLLTYDGRYEDVTA